MVDTSASVVLRAFDVTAKLLNTTTQGQAMSQATKDRSMALGAGSMGAGGDGPTRGEESLTPPSRDEGKLPKITGSSAAKDEEISHIPLSFAQERLWFLDQLGLVGAAYNMSMALRLEGNLNVEALGCSLAELVHRHESLRTRFGVANGVPHQLIEPPGNLELRRSDLTHEPNRRLREQQLHEFMQRERQHRFDLHTGPLFRAVLVRLDIERYALLLTMHHIVADGWSLGVIRRELGALYAAFSHGQLSPLPELTAQYADYAIWERERLQGEGLQEQLRYWSERLRGAPPKLELPTDRPRPTVESFRGAELRFILPVTLSRALKELSGREGATLFMVVLAAYQILLWRWSGQQDIVVGSPIAERTTRDFEGLIGFFLNMLVLRTDVSGKQSFRQLLKRVRETTLEAYAHKDLPFDALVKELRPDRTLTQHPIFQVALTLQNYPRDYLQLAGLKWTQIDVPRVTARFELELFLREDADGISGVFEYATDLFDEDTIKRMAAHFQALLEGIVLNPDCLIHQLPLLSAAEKQLLCEWSAGGTAHSQDVLIHQRFEEQVRRTPNALAVVCEGQSLTYAELNRRANQLSWYLRAMGVGPDRLVALCIERSLEMVVSLLGIVKAGGAYVPLDPAYPSERMAYMLEDAAPMALLTQERLKPHFQTTGMKVIAVDSDWAEIAQQPLGNQDPKTLGLRSDHLAYVIYTSGSTGQPKGVMVEHRNVIRLFRATEAWFGFNDRDVWTLFHSIAFDFSVWELWGALLHGGRVVVVPYLTARSPRDFYRMLCNEGITVLNQTPTAFAQLVEAQEQSDDKHSLRVVIFGGEALEIRRLRPWVARNGAETPVLVNMYGITETTVHVTYLRLTNDDIESEVRCVIGEPIPDLRLSIADPYGQPVPIGVVGEIYVSGGGGARGYLNHPKLTAERFVADPSARGYQMRMYRSGDLGRRRAEGPVEYLGRNDQQVKIRGFRIELGEIEKCLTKHLGVRAAVVVVQKDERQEKILVAYVVPKNATIADVSLRPEALRTYLIDMLPEYMVPSFFVMLERMPLTSNGKLDRRRLPSPKIDTSTSRDYEAPRGEAEKVIAETWQDLLRVKSVSRQDNFFALGGHSLLVIRSLFKVNQVLGSSLTVRDVYRSPTIQALATRILGDVHGDDLVDLRKEAYLDERIRVSSGTRRVPASSILLTGASGFVGRFLLAQLLRDTHATIHCLVRDNSHNDGLVRLRRMLESWDLWRDEFESRIVAVAGDLRLPCLGIDELTYSALSRCIDSIYHCATSMNHLESYEMAKPANVDSARELLKFATTHRTKLINYISTLSVFRPSIVSTARVVDEASAIDDEKHSASSGYTASKWVAEKMFMIAAERTIPCNIFRLGLVWADTQQGRYDELQREYRVFKSCLLSGYGIKNYRYVMAPTPVDYAVRAVSYLAERHHREGVFHISSSRQMTEGVFERCNEITSASLKLISYYDWICEIKRLHHTGCSLPAIPLIEFAFSMNKDSFQDYQRRVGSTSVHVDCTRTHRELERAGIVAPALDDNLLKVFLNCISSRDTEVRSKLASKWAQISQE